MSAVPHPRRRWLRFSLKTLFFGMLVLGSALGWLVAVAKRAHDLREVVRRIESLGGEVQYASMVWDPATDKPSPRGNRLLRRIFGEDLYSPVVSVYFTAPISDADLLVLNELPALLTGLAIDGGNITRKGLAHLSDLDNLKDLSLMNTAVTTSDLSESTVGRRLQQLTLYGPTVVDATLTDLPKLKKLELLQLVRANVTDDGLRSVARCGWLHSFDLMQCSAITDQGLIQLQGLKNLRHLNVVGGPTTEAGLVLVGHLPRLEELDVRGTTLTERGMGHLRGLKSMRHLHLGGCQVTDAGMLHLREMPNLEFLDLTESLITDAALVNLAEFSRLKMFILSSKNTTDAGIGHLRGLIGLKHLQVGPGFTRDGALQLKQALPNCRIEYVDANGGVDDLR